MSPVAQLIIYICAVRMSKCLTHRKQQAGNRARGEVFAEKPSQTELTETLLWFEMKYFQNQSCCVILDLDWLAVCLSGVYKSTQRRRGV